MCWSWSCWHIFSKLILKEENNPNFKSTIIIPKFANKLPMLRGPLQYTYPASNYFPIFEKVPVLSPMFADLHPHVQGPIYIKQNISTIKIFSHVWKVFNYPHVWKFFPLFAKVLPHVARTGTLSKSISPTLNYCPQCMKSI